MLCSINLSYRYTTPHVRYMDKFGRYGSKKAANSLVERMHKCLRIHIVYPFDCTYEGSVLKVTKTFFSKINVINR